MRKILSVVLAGALACCLLVGCGNGGGLPGPEPGANRISQRQSRGSSQRRLQRTCTGRPDRIAGSTLVSCPFRDEAQTQELT
jgi:hypothetical protein